METKDKALILEQFARAFTLGEINRDFFTDFVIYNDLGIPLAQVITYNLADLTEEGQNFLEETWQEFCDICGVDSEDEYEDFDEMIELLEEGGQED